MDFDSTSEQSSRYSDAWANEKNVFLHSTRGFISNRADYKNDFWLSVKFPGNQFFNVTSMVLKKITHSCCTKRTINGFSLQYLVKGKWINYNNGDIIQTGQLPDDDVESDRLIEFTPFSAQQVRITIPRSERSHGSAQGRIEFLIFGPLEAEKKKTVIKTTTKTNTTTTCNGTTVDTSTTTEQSDGQSGDSQDGTSSTSAETTEDDSETDTSVASSGGSNFNNTATKRAIIDIGSTTEQSSMYDKTWSTARWANIKSTRAFWNQKGDDSSFWIKVIFPAGKHYQVSTMIIKKGARKSHEPYLINGVQFEYESGGKWVQYNGGAVIKTGMHTEDDKETEYTIDFYPPFLATQVKATVPRADRSDTYCGGRIEYLIEGPTKGPEVITVNTTTSSNDDDGEGETNVEDESGSETNTTITTTSTGQIITTKTTTDSEGVTTTTRTSTTSKGNTTIINGCNMTTPLPGCSTTTTIIGDSDDDKPVTNDTTISGSTPGAPPKKERPHEAILDYGSSSEQSSYWSSSWGGEDNVRIDSKTGFYPKDSDSDKDFWITTKFPAGKHYEVNELILKKIVHSCCTKKVVSGVQIEYMQNGEWIKWNNGQIIKTGQLPSDDVEMERKIIFNQPFIATEVKIIIPVSEKF